MDAATTAVILVGYQNDYFSAEGILHSALEDNSRVQEVLNNTLTLLEALKPSSVPFIHTPIVFTEDYSELVEPVGILKIIKDTGAFKRGAPGSQTVPELMALGARMLSLPGKRGLNCFSNTSVHEHLQRAGVSDVLIAGAVTSLCIDTAGREAADLGYRVHILEDCMVARTSFEQEYFAKEIMPLYANVIDSKAVIAQLCA